MACYTVDTTLKFTFPDGCKVAKCDDWNFYRNQFCNIRHEKNNGVKCVDLLVISSDKILWLIEAKDYRVYRRKKTKHPSIEMRDKVFDTLAMLLPAACNAEGDEQDIAKMAIKAKKIHIVLHYEQPNTSSKLFKKDFELNDIQMKMKQIVKSIDPHPIVMGIQSKPASIPWDVR